MARHVAPIHRSQKQLSDFNVRFGVLVIAPVVAVTAFWDIGTRGAGWLFSAARAFVGL